MEPTLDTINASRLNQVIQNVYTDLALNPSRPFHFHTGRQLAEKLHYSDDLLRIVPEAALASFAGSGNPFVIDILDANAHVLDIGSGAGTDSIIAGRVVGPRGRVTGIDFTRAMVDRARDHAREAGLDNVEFILDDARRLPLPDASVDVIISNGVFNLCPDKLAVFREMHRVLKPGGKIQIADVLLDRQVPGHHSDWVPLWIDGIAGSLPLDTYILHLRDAGFTDVRIVRSFDVFAEAVVENSALAYGARGYNVRAVKTNG